MRVQRQQLLAYVIVVVLFLGGMAYIRYDSKRQDDLLSAVALQRRVEVKAEVCTALRKSQNTLADLIELASTPRPDDTPIEADQREQYRQDALERLAEDDECEGAAPPVNTSPTPPLPLDGASQVFVGSRGETGATGETGPRGLQGLQGPTGPQGVAGPRGDPAPVVDYTCTAVPGRLLDGTNVFNCQPVR